MAAELDDAAVQRDLIRPRLREAKPGTVRKEASLLMAVLRAAHRDGLVNRVPHVQLPPTSPARERWLTPDELDRLEDAARGMRQDPARMERLEVFIALARHTGARKQAIYELPWSRVDLDRRAIDFGAGAGKKRRARGVPINDELLAVLQDWKLQQGGAELVLEGGKLHWGFGQAAKRAGLQGITPHVLRHSLASNAAQRGVALHLVAQVLGNTAAVVEKTYSKFTPASLSTVVEAGRSAGRKRPAGAL
jgi:integrase